MQGGTTEAWEGDDMNLKSEWKERKERNTTRQPHTVPALRRLRHRHPQLQARLRSLGKPVQRAGREGGKEECGQSEQSWSTQMMLDIKQGRNTVKQEEARGDAVWIQPLAWVLVPVSFLDVLFTGSQDATCTSGWSFVCSVADVGLVSECMCNIVNAGYIPGVVFPKVRAHVQNLCLNGDIRK